VVVAENGRLAVEAHASQAFDLVLMDVQMPEMDGFQATQAIRTAERASGRHVPIIAMTAHALPGDREKCLEAGMDDYVSKPIRRESLMRAIENATGAPQGAVDWSISLAQVEGNRELLRSVVEAFLDEIQDNLAQLPQLIEADNWSEVRRRAHMLKGAMRMFGAAEAQSLGQQLESQGEVKVQSEARELLARLEKAVGDVLPELAWFVERGWSEANGLEQG
jgi:CheY-like chemotaxis protein/HPt (histidine-containing phosphotransfer) domain-containing protein